MARMKFDLTRKSTWKKILNVGLAVLFVAGAIFGVVKLSGRLKDDKKKISPIWEVGVISEKDGKADPDAKTSIYTKDAFDAKGLEIELDFDSDVTYQVFWYDSVGEYVATYTSTEMNKGYAPYAPAGHKARIEITPVISEEDDDGEISWLETFKYSKQIEIRVDKNQELKAKDFTEHTLAEGMFTKHEGSVKFSSSGVVSYDENTNTTYSFTNNGSSLYSAVYVKTFALQESNTGLHVRLLDGTVISFYSSDLTYSAVATDSPLPMRAKDAILLPRGATLYVWGLFGEAGTEAGPENTVLCFY